MYYRPAANSSLYLLARLFVQATVLPPCSDALMMVKFKSCETPLLVHCKLNIWTTNRYYFYFPSLAVTSVFKLPVCFYRAMSPSDMSCLWWVQFSQYLSFKFICCAVHEIVAGNSWFGNSWGHFCPERDRMFSLHWIYQFVAFFSAGFLFSIYFPFCGTSPPPEMTINCALNICISPLLTHSWMKWNFC